ncbi:MAG: GAF domain-containing protein [Chloroflexota bacterium]
MEMKRLFTGWKASLRTRLERLLEQKWLPLGLRAKMSAMVIVGLVGLMLVFAMLGISSARQATQKVLSERVMLARLGAATLDANIAHLQDTLTLLARQPVFQDQQASQVERDQALSQVGVLAHGVALLDQAGRLVFSSNLADQTLQWEEIGAVKQALAGSSTSLSLLIESSLHAVIVVPVQDAAGVTHGALATMMDLGDPSIFPFERPLDLGKTGTLDVIDASGLVLASTDSERILQGRGIDPDERSAAISKLFIAGAPGVETCLGCYGDASTRAYGESSDEVIAFAPLKLAPWGVIVRQQATEAFAPVRNLMFINLALGLLTIIGALILVGITTSSVITPVQALTLATQRIGAGDLQTPINLPVRRGWRKDEIGLLADSFDAMRQRLMHSMEEIRSLNQDLDERVQIRTQEARAAQLEAQAARDSLQAVVDSLERRNQYLSILNSIASTVNRSLDLQEILEHSLEEVLRMTSIDVGAIFLQVENQTNMQLMTCQGISSEAAQLASQLGMLDGSCGGVREKGEIIVVPDLSHYRGVRGRSLRKEQLSTLVHVPITSRGLTVGSMCVATHAPRKFDTEEQELLSAIASQIGVAIENARLYAEVQHKEQVRGELFKKAITAQEEERNRIARELHDDTSQNLTALLFAAQEILEIAEREAPKESQRIERRVQDMHDLVQHTLDGVHKLIFDLRPSMLDHLGLLPALRWFAESRLQPKGMNVSVEEKCDSHRLSPEVETALFRVVQEAIMNVARHSGARNAHLSFCLSDGRVEIGLEDDGIGFDLTEVDVEPGSMRGLGLLGMQERLELLGGDLEVFSAPGSGTHLFIHVPAQTSKEAQDQSHRSLAHV